MEIPLEPLRDGRRIPAPEPHSHDDSEPAVVEMDMSEGASMSEVQVDGSLDVDDDGRPLTPEEQREKMQFYAEQVVALMLPILATFVLTVWWVDVIYGGRNVIYSGVLLYQESTDDSFWQVLRGSITNALIILGAVLISTCVFIALFYYNCMKIIYGWIGTSTIMILGGIGGIVFYQLLAEYDVAFDWPTLVFLLLNFAAVGVTTIFWHGPLLLTQCYLVVLSGLMATNLVALPEWTAWALLAVISIYDLFAVLCPRGPLKVLVNTAQERNQSIPGLLYSAGMAQRARYTPAGVYVTVETDDDDHVPDHMDDGNVGLLESAAAAAAADEQEDLATMAAAASKRRAQGGVELAEAGPAGAAALQQQQEEEDDGDHPVQLGLGDFIFYSVLVGRAALTDWVTVVTCSLATMVGLCITLFLLALQRKPLPALPISIALGIVFYFATSACMSPFVAALTVKGVHI